MLHGELPGRQLRHSRRRSDLRAWQRIQRRYRHRLVADPVPELEPEPTPPPPATEDNLLAWSRRLHGLYCARRLRAGEAGEVALPPCRLTARDPARIFRRQAGRCALSGIPLTLRLPDDEDPDGAFLDYTRRKCGYTPERARLVARPLGLARLLAGRPCSAGPSWEHGHSGNLVAAGPPLYLVPRYPVQGSILCGYWEHLRGSKRFAAYPWRLHCMVPEVFGPYWLPDNGWLELVCLEWREGRPQQSWFTTLHISESCVRVEATATRSWSRDVGRSRAFDYRYPHPDLFGELDKAVLWAFQAYCRREYLGESPDADY